MGSSPSTWLFPWPPSQSVAHLSSTTTKSSWSFCSRHPTNQVKKGEVTAWVHLCPDQTQDSLLPQPGIATVLTALLNTVWREYGAATRGYTVIAGDWYNLK